MYKNSKLSPVGFDDVKWTKGFWRDKEDLCINSTIDSVYNALNNEENSAQFKNFHILAGEIDGEYSGFTHWGDGDCYKWIEAAVCIWHKTKNADLKHKIDAEVNAIANAQESDGYIDTFIQMNNKKRFATSVYHEDYNFGHLFTAAATHFLLTGENTFIQVAKKAADCLYREFAKEKVEYPHFGWNPSHIMGLVDMYRATKDEKYLQLAKIFTELKGSADVHFEMIERPGIPDSGGDLNQDRVKLEDETMPEGHAVTAVYLYAGAADICCETNYSKAQKAIETISENLYNSRIYITGGVGPTHFGYSSRNDHVREAFANDYILPLSTAYNETCANIGNAMWQYRMFLLTGKANYMDNVENVLYNSGLSGMSADGKKFRYTNPLKWYGEKQTLLSADSYERWSTNHCYCCPPQMARTIAKMSTLACSKAENALYINLYSGCEINTVVSGKNVDLNIESNYPWEDTVTITINKDISDFNLNLRIPKFSNSTSLAYSNNICKVHAGTYYTIHSDFKKGEQIVLKLDMGIKAVRTNAKVEASKNQVCFMRGPIVYCLEAPDIERGNIDEIYVALNSEIEAKHNSELLGGITELHTNAYLMQNISQLYSVYGNANFEKIQIKLIPYYAWNNRGVHEMSVFMPVLIAPN